MNININKLKEKIYADSPFDLASVEDNAYRSGVDYALQLVEKELK